MKELIIISIIISTLAVGIIYETNKSVESIKKAVLSTYQTGN